jgi:hypothetical protein
MRVTRSRELVAEGYRPSAVVRVAQLSREATRCPLAAVHQAGASVRARAGGQSHCCPGVERGLD